MRVRFARAVAAAAAGFLALLLVEGALHVVRPAVEYQYAPQRIDVSHFRPSATLPFELRVGQQSRFRMLEFDTTVRTNQFGLRDDEVDMGLPRVLCLGDSFTFGFGVEGPEAFCARLEQQFGGRYDFVNAGFADGNAPDTYAVWLARHRGALAPRALVVSLFQNDLGDLAQHQWIGEGATPRQIVQPGTIVTPDGAWMRDSTLARWPSWARTLLKQSYVVALIRDRVLKDVGDPSMSVPTPAADASAPTAIAGRSLEDERFFEALEMLRTAALGTPLVFHLIPERGQLQPSHMDGLVQAFASLHGIRIVAQYEAFTTADYFDLDGHWRASGHLKAAGYLHAALTAMGL